MKQENVFYKIGTPCLKVKLVTRHSFRATATDMSDEKLIQNI